MRASKGRIEIIRNPGGVLVTDVGPPAAALEVVIEPALKMIEFPDEYPIITKT